MAAPFLLHQLISRAAPDRHAVGYGGTERITYGELELRSDRLAARLQELGVEAGDRVGLYQPKSIDTVCAIIAILKCGAAYVPIDPVAPADRARFILDHCGVEVLFCGGRPLKSFGEDRRRILAPDEVSAICTNGDAGVFEPPNVTDTALAYVLYTSGSTGAPKGVAITHAQSLTFVRTATEIFAMTAADVTASHAPFNFDLSVIDLYCTFLAGGRVELIPETWLAFPARISKLIAEAGISVWNSVPSALVQLANHGALAERDLSKLRLIMFAGEPFPVKHLRTLYMLINQSMLINVYGQTEANSSTYHVIRQIPDNDDAVLPVGKTFPNYDVMLIGEGGQHIRDVAVEGELYVAGGAVASGYYADEERTAKAFVQHPLKRGIGERVYKTGDRFMYDANGDLVFRGRMDSAVKVRGFRVEVGEVEAAIAGFEGVDEVCVIARPDEAVGHALLAYVAGRAGASVDQNALLKHVSAKLPRYMLPASITTMRALPRTPNGKIDRRALAEQAATAGLDGDRGPE